MGSFWESSCGRGWWIEGWGKSWCWAVGGRLSSAKAASWSQKCRRERQHKAVKIFWQFKILSHNRSPMEWKQSGSEGTGSQSPYTKINFRWVTSSSSAASQTMSTGCRGKEKQTNPPASTHLIYSNNNVIYNPEWINTPHCPTQLLQCSDRVWHTCARMLILPNMHLSTVCRCESSCLLWSVRYPPECTWG